MSRIITINIETLLKETNKIFESTPEEREIKAPEFTLQEAIDFFKNRNTPLEPKEPGFIVVDPLYLLLDLQEMRLTQDQSSGHLRDIVRTALEQEPLTSTHLRLEKRNLQVHSSCIQRVSLHPCKLSIINCFARPLKQALLQCISFFVVLARKYR